ncbi:hypothetical protein Bca52824_002676 [Brassica carinata]|uniref:Uncharacterized protein n=1 Tax=Brassica carinata TaxID=52824 RepID=A0A8X7WKQ2_BRACI|nr:hypothetical protein Bca52824_002676 [Brassica carinata]
MKYIHGKCWEDIADAIRQAKNLIYIIGWSVYHPVRLTSVDDGPRQPWHDLLSKIDGPAAYDVLANFEQRWLKASEKRHRISIHRSSSEDALLKIDRIPNIMGLSEASLVSDNDPESWHVQVFRSLDSTSVKGFPKDSKEASGKNFLCGKNILVDMSIHTDYVKAIRSAQHFIYVENHQYFFGIVHSTGIHIMTSSIRTKEQPNIGIQTSGIRSSFCEESTLAQTTNQVDQSPSARSFFCNKSSRSLNAMWLNHSNQSLLPFHPTHQPIIEKTKGANNLIPMEIALKIASKINAREKFSPYIVISMASPGMAQQAET